MTKKNTAADRALLPVAVAQRLGVKVRKGARRMRDAGVTEQLTAKQANKWMRPEADPPEWFTQMLADRAADKAARDRRKQHRQIEDEHRDVLAEERVRERLLSGSGRIKGDRDEHFAANFAFEAMKQLVRSDGDVSLLGEIDLAALRWAGVNPSVHSTWFLHGHSCCDWQREQDQRGMRQAVHEAQLWQNPPHRPEQYVADTDRCVWSSRTMLRARGWTDAAMRDYLPEPEGYKVNPHYSMQHPMPVWSPATIGRIESSQSWQDWLVRSLRRRKVSSVSEIRGQFDERVREKLERVDGCISQGEDVR